MELLGPRSGPSDIGKLPIRKRIEHIYFMVAEESIKVDRKLRFLENNFGKFSTAAHDAVARLQLPVSMSPFQD